MKLIYFLIALAASVVVNVTASGQKWVTMMQDQNVNFYAVQKEFNRDWSAKEKDVNVQNNNPAPTDESGVVEKEREGGYMPYKRWEYFMEPRVYPTGNRLKPSLAAEEFQKYKEQYAARGTTDPGTQGLANWKIIGPIAQGANGRINCVQFHPTDTNIIYAGAANGGLWISHNRGTTWTTNTDNLGSLGVSDIAINPVNPNIMYIATGDCDHSDSYSIGILKSTDAAATWNATGLTYTWPQARRIFKIIINPLNPNTLLAATSVGIYRSLNGGTSWTASVSSGSFNDLVYKPGDTTIVYAATTTVFYRSTNGGTSFSTIAGGLPASSSLNRIKIGVTPADPAYVYLITGSSANSGTYGFYHSTDAGLTFTQKSTTNTLGSQSWYSCAISVSPTNKLEIVVGGLNIYRSTDGGANWTKIGDWQGSGAAFEHADVHDLKYKPNSTGIYTGNDGGVYSTFNTGGSWASLAGNGLQVAQAYNLGLSGVSTNKLITGWQDNGTSILNGTTWTRPVGGDGMIAFIDWSSDSYMYAEYYNGSLVRSTNGGANFSAIGGSISETGAWVTPWLQDTKTAQTIYAGYANVWKSTDRGTNWSAISAFTGTSTIRSLAVAPSDPNYIYAARTTAIYKTTNGGTSWSTITGSLPVGSASISYIAIKSTDPNTVWVTFSGFSSGTKVYKTTNGGTSWTNVTGTLPNLPATCIVYQNGTNDGLYVGMDIGVYYRDASMTDWQPFYDGLPNVWVTDLEIQYSIGKLRASTFGRGLWEADLFNSGANNPVAAFTASNLSFCTPQSVQFTDQSSFSPSSWLWNFGDGTTSTLQNPVHNYTANGTYTVTLKVTNATGSDSTIKTSYITVAIPVNPTTTSASRCGDGTLNLAALAMNGGSLSWYDSLAGVVPISSGNGFVTPVLSTTKTYYVEESIPGPLQSVGPPDSSFGAGAQFNANDVHGLYFDVYVKSTLISVVVDEYAAGSRTIQLLDGSSNIVNSVTLTIPSGRSTVPLNFSINPGSGYFLKFSGTVDAYRNSSGPSYPYTLPGVMSITGSDVTGYYYFFYDWKVQKAACTSARVPVTATILKGTPTISQNGDTLTSSSGNTYQWFLNGSPIPGATGQKYVALVSGNYSVQVTGNGCTLMSVPFTLIITGIMEEQISGFSIYPNPATDELWITATGLRGMDGTVSVNITNVLGESVFYSQFTVHQSQIASAIDIASFPKGIYFVELLHEDGKWIQRVVKQ